MKKNIAVLALLVGLFPFTASAAFDTDLRYGSSGAKVLELQEFLTSEGVYAGPITGNFYALTLAGVKAFQAKHSVSPASGFFGPLTRGVANELLSATLEESDEEAGATPVQSGGIGSDPIGSAPIGGDSEEVESAPSYDVTPVVSISSDVKPGTDKKYMRVSTQEDYDFAIFKVWTETNSLVVEAGSLNSQTTLAPGNYTWEARAYWDSKYNAATKKYEGGTEVVKTGSFTVE
jgi:hypothetical protein